MARKGFRFSKVEKWTQTAARARNFFFFFFNYCRDRDLVFHLLEFERNARRAVGSDRARVNRARLLRRGHPLETATQAARARLLRRGHRDPLVIGTRAVFASYFSGPPFYSELTEPTSEKCFVVMPCSKWSEP